MTPYRVVTLLELLKYNADAFCRLSSLIGQGIAMIGTGHPVDAGHLGGTFGELLRETDKLGLKSSSRQLRRIWDDFENGNVQWPAVRSSLIELTNRLHDDLEARTFIAIPSEMAHLYEQVEPPFGRVVTDAFPLAAEDVSEAAKCLSLGRYTATVFHLMRAMEGAVQRLATRLGVQNVERAWGILLSDIARAIEALPKGPDRTKWSAIHAHLYHVKEAWRNDTMHPKQTYTFEEAKAAFDAVKVFLNALAPSV